MAAQDEERKASTASAPKYNLASEDDAAVLGKDNLQSNERTLVSQLTQQSLDTSKNSVATLR